MFTTANREKPVKIHNSGQKHFLLGYKYVCQIPHDITGSNQLPIHQNFGSLEGQDASPLLNP